MSSKSFMQIFEDLTTCCRANAKSYLTPKVDLIMRTRYLVLKLQSVIARQQRKLHMFSAQKSSPRRFFGDRSCLFAHVFYEPSR